LIKDKSININMELSIKYALNIPKEILLSGEKNIEMIPAEKNKIHGIKKGFFKKTIIFFEKSFLIKLNIRNIKNTIQITISKKFIGRPNKLNLIK